MIQGGKVLQARNKFWGLRRNFRTEFYFVCRKASNPGLSFEIRIFLQISKIAEKAFSYLQEQKNNILLQPQPPGWRNW